MKDPIVSIVCPVFNRESFLKKAVLSVIAQTFQAWELIIVNDGSTDSSEAIASCFVRRDPDRIRLLTQENQGVAAAKNLGLRSARGQFVAFIDSDDTWPSTKLEKQVLAFKAHPDAAFIYTGYTLVDSEGQRLEIVTPDPAFQGDIWEKLWLHRNNILGGTIMLRKSLLDITGLFDPNFKGAENLDFRIRLARMGSVVFVEDPLYQYRKHSESLVSDRKRVLDTHWQLIQKHFPSASSRSSSLYRRVLAIHEEKLGDLAFEHASYPDARRHFFYSLQLSPLNANLAIKLLRTVGGRDLNKLIQLLRRSHH